MISRSGIAAIRAFEYTVGPIEPDEDDEIVFMREVAEAAR